MSDLSQFFGVDVATAQFCSWRRCLSKWSPAMLTLFFGIGFLGLCAVGVKAQEILPPGGGAAEHERISLGVNGIRGQRGLPALSEDARLRHAAQNYVHFLAMGNHREGAPGIHTADGKNPQQRANDAGFRCPVSENVAAAWFSPSCQGTNPACDNSNRATAQAINFWTNSPPHFATMTNPSFTLTGIGVDAWKFGNEDFYIFVMLFSAPCP